MKSKFSTQEKLEIELLENKIKSIDILKIYNKVFHVTDIV